MRLVLFFFFCKVWWDPRTGGRSPGRIGGRRGEAGEERVESGSSKRIKSVWEKQGEIMQNCLIFRSRKRT